MSAPVAAAFCPRTGKVSYETPVAARRAANASHKLGRTRAHHVYRCPHCDRFHLTKADQR